MEHRWWIVKVYDRESGTTTTLSKYAINEDDIKEQLMEDGLWEFVNAHLEDE